MVCIFVALPGKASKIKTISLQIYNFNVSSQQFQLQHSKNWNVIDNSILTRLQSIVLVASLN